MKHWRTTLAGIGSALAALLGVLATVPHETGMQHLPEHWRARVLIGSVIAAFVLRCWQAVASADKPQGGA